MMTSSVLTVWMSDARQIHHGTAEENKEIEQEREYDVSTNEQQSGESSYSMDSTQEQDSDSTSSTEYDESHELRGKAPRVNNDSSKSRKRGVPKNCGPQVTDECCPEKLSPSNTPEEPENAGGPAGGSCVCRCAEKVVDTKGDALGEDDSANPRFCPKGKGSWPGLPGAKKSSQRKHHKLKYKLH